MEYNPIPFDQTYILYDPSDLVSMACVHLSLLPVYVMVFYTSWFLITREIEPVIIVGGHLASEIANKIAKTILKEPRPDFHKGFGGSGSLSYGMPSAHSQFMGLFAGYYVCVCIFKLNHFSLLKKAMCCAVLVGSSSLVAFSRVYLLYHTPQQVLVGSILGLILGPLYFIIISIARDVGFIDWIIDWPIIKYFYVKDSYYHCYQTYEDEYSHYLNLKKQVKKD